MGRTEKRRESWMTALSLQRKRLSRTIRVQRLTRRAREDDARGARANSINYDSVYSTTAGEGADLFEAFEMDSPFAAPSPDRQERQNDSKSRTRRRVGGTRRDKKLTRPPKETKSSASSESGRSGSGKQSKAKHGRGDKGRQTRVESDDEEDDLPRGSTLASFLEDNRYNSLRAKALREVEEMENLIERARRGQKEDAAAEGLEDHLKNVLVFKPRKTNFTRRERGRKLGSKAARYLPSPTSPSSSSSSSSTSATSSSPPSRATGRKTHKLRATGAKAKASVNCPSHDPIADML